MALNSTSVTKAFEILEAMAARPGPWGVSALSRELDATKSNVHRLLRTLVDLKYVRFDARSSKYYATLRVWEIGAQVASGFDIRRIAQPHMAILADTVKQTVHLSVLEGCEVVYIDRIEARSSLTAQVDIGSRAPAQCVATGLAMMAFLPPQRLSDWQRPLERPTEFSPASYADVLALLEPIRQRGYARTRGSWRRGVLGLAAPVFNGTGNVAGALGLSCVDIGIDQEAEEEMARHVIRNAQELSRDMGSRE